MNTSPNTTALRIIVSGGGTGGHIFPAVSIAGKLLELNPGADILFVGALGRMEMEKVPAAGFPIKGLPVSGFDRHNLLRNFQVLFHLFQSVRQARKIIREFRPNVAVGVGGYASAPVLLAAGWAGVPTLIQEQNSYAGVANKWLARRAKSICVAYPGMERFFPAGKIQVTGNPVRTVLEQPLPPREEACRFFGLDPARKVLLSLGGSLGARTINESLAAGVCRLPEDIQLLWQTGPGYYERAAALSKEHPGVQVHAFIQRMEMAFSAADMVISRAGAGTISELSILGKPCILVPSPNVAEDHQTRNAEVLAKHGAALMISDASAREQLFPKAIQCIRDEQACLALAAAIRQFAHPGASEIIAKKVLELCVR